MNKVKKKYSFLSNLKFVLKNMWSLQKSSVIFIFLRSPFTVIISFLGIYLSKEVIAAVTQNKSPGEVLFVIAAVSLTMLLSYTINNYMDSKLYSFNMVHDFNYQAVLFDKCIDSDYENMESPAGLTRYSKAMENTGGDQSGSRIVMRVMSSIIANVIGIISYAVILINLSVWILLVVTLTTLSGFFIMKMTASWSYNNKDNWKTYDRKLDYLKANSGDFTRAKDLRLYGMTDWFKDVFTNALSDRMKWHKKEKLYGLRIGSLQSVLSLIRECVSYGFLVYLIFAKNLAVDDFVMYFGIIGGFSAWLNGMVGNLNSINRFNLSFSEMREFLAYPDTANHGVGIPLPNETFSIEFKNVSYRYAGSGEDIIHNLSFKIKKGEKLAVVGLNGAGKTTIVKLMCGLYTPSKGEILINGQPVNAYNREEYYSLFSVVFQDIFILPVSIAKNVSSSVEDETDRKKAQNALNLAGLSSKIESLPDGMDTRLVKSVYDDAVDLSGGEMQKLALARALYKDGKALILDEPTAALDPIAESNIYMEYNRMTAGHTSVFISHRLASTRFCDRIFFLENGKIIECGSHDELMKQQGKYFEMFAIQSHYYKEEAIENENI